MSPAVILADKDLGVRHGQLVQNREVAGEAIYQVGAFDLFLQRMGHHLIKEDKP